MKRRKLWDRRPLLIDERAGSAIEMNDMVSNSGSSSLVIYFERGKSTTQEIILEGKEWINAGL